MLGGKRLHATMVATNDELGRHWCTAGEKLIQLTSRGGGVVTVDVRCWNQATKELRPVAEFATTKYSEGMTHDGSDIVFDANFISFCYYRCLQLLPLATTFPTSSMMMVHPRQQRRRFLAATIVSFCYYRRRCLLHASRISCDVRRWRRRFFATTAAGFCIIQFTTN